MSATRSIRDLPGPHGLPLLGNALQLLPVSRAHLRVEAWCERYGPVFQFRAGGRRWVALADQEEINALLRGHGFIEQVRAQMRQRPELRDEPENFPQAMLAAQSEGSFTDEEVIAT